MADRKQFSFLKIILAPLIWLLQACSPLGPHVNKEISDNHYYTKDKKDIIFSRMGNWFELSKDNMHVDVASFELLNSELSKDKNTAYYKHYPVQDVDLDLTSFKAQTNNWMKSYGMDKDNVYYFDASNYKSVKTKIVVSADPNSFLVTDYNWAKDKDHHFYQNRLIEVDYASFELVNRNFARDNYKGYYYSEELFGEIEMDGKSLVKIDDYYAKDQNNIYYYAWYFGQELVNELKVISYVDFNKVKVWNESHLQVDDKIYYLGFETEITDLENLTVFDYSYAKDSKNVYYNGNPIKETDPSTFGFDKKSYRYKDKNATYESGKRVELE